MLKMLHARAAQRNARPTERDAIIPSLASIAGSGYHTHVMIKAYWIIVP